MVEHNGITEMKDIYEAGTKSAIYRIGPIEYSLTPTLCKSKKDGKYIIVDGLQRTSTLDEFINEDGFDFNKADRSKKLRSV